MSASYPLLDRPPHSLLFRSPDRTITAESFLNEAHALAATLPPGRHLLNLCRDRYAFALAFAAALISEKLCLLTGERSAAVLDALAASYQGCVLATDDPAQPAPAGATLHRVRPLASSARSANLTFPAERAVAIVFTSGSTGAPVAHVKSWGALVERSRAAAIRFGLMEHDPVSIVGTVPPQHMYGFETTILLPLHAAASSWCGPVFFPEDMRAALAAVPSPRLLITTPLQLRTLLRGLTDLPKLHACISATAPLEAKLAAEAEARWNAPVLEIFGATEVGSIASRRTLHDEDWSLYPGLALTRSTPGFRVSAPYATSERLDDAVELAAPDRFRLLGRRKDIVKLGGHRISLAALNRILLGLDGVEDGVFVLPETAGPQGNTRLAAIVVAPRRSAASLVDELRALIAPVFLPRRIVHVDAMPRNGLGKLSRERLLDALSRDDAA